MTSLLDIAVAHCAALVETSGTLTSVCGALFLAGLLGGFTHCAFMCGPFVVAQVTRRLESVTVEGMSESNRLKNALLFPYHMGRITTYVILGALTGGLVGGLSASWQTASGLILLVAGLSFLASITPLHKHKIPAPEWLLFFQNRVLHFAAPFSLSPFGGRGYSLGLVLGLLPCPMIWSGLLAAAGTGGAAQGALSMACLGIGTIPGLVVAAFAGRSFVESFRIRVRPAAKVMMGVAGLWLCFLSIGLLF